MSEDPVLPPDDDPLGIEGSEELTGPDPVEPTPEPVAAAAPTEPDELAPIAEAVTGELPPPPAPRAASGASGLARKDGRRDRRGLLRRAGRTAGCFDRRRRSLAERDPRRRGSV